jgi:Protein of unknown function (DUF551)
MNWQPIETIPHDRFVLIYATDGNFSKTFVGKLNIKFHAVDTWNFYGDDRWEYPTDKNDHSIDIKQIHIQCRATHWMPLPDPPQMTIETDDRRMRPEDLTGTIKG